MNEGDELENAAGFISELEIMDRARNYNRWIFENMKPFLGSNILEVGCGIGTFTGYLVQTDAKVTAIDIDERCVLRVKERIKGELFRVIKMPAEQVQDLGEVFDTVILLNVLEHVEEDTEFAGRLGNVLRGNLILLVPAFQFLFGKTDRLVGHFRRYSRSSLLAVVESAGFEVLTCRYFNSAGFFAWFIMNRIIKQETNKPSTVRVYDRFVVPFLRVFERIFHPPFGQSLFLVARHPGPTAR